MQPEISMRNPAADGSTADLERRIAELTHELAVSRQQFRNIVEQSIQGIAVLMQSGFVFVNDAFCQMFGYRREELLGAPPWLLHPSNREELAARARARASGDASNQRYEIHGQRKDGGVLWVEYMTSVVEWKGERATQLVALDITDRKQAESRMAAQERKYRDLFENAPLPMFRSTHDRRFVEINPALCAFVGYTPEELHRMRAGDFLHPDDFDELTARMQELWSRRCERATLEHRIVRKDGTALWVLSTSCLVPDDNGELTHLIVQFQDVNERRRIERALADREQRYRDSFENAPVALCRIGDDKRFIEANAAFRKLVGYAAEELYALRTPDVMHPDDRDTVVPVVADLRARRIDHAEVEHRLRTKDGRVLWVQSWVRYLDDREGEPPCLLSHFQDITARRKAEDMLVVSERKYRETFENTPMAMFRSGSDHAVIEVNRAFQDMLGYTSEDLRGKRPHMLIHPDDMEKVLTRTSDVWDGHATRVENEYRIRRKDGRYIWVSASRCLTPDEDGRLNHLLVQLQDITARREAEAALQEREAIYRALAEESLQGLMISERGKVVFANGVFARMFGYTVDEILAMSSNAELYHPEDRAKIEAFIRLRHEGDRSVRRYECRCIRKDGTVFWIEQLSSPVDWFGRQATQVVTIDISERKLAEQMLAESERQYREMFENAPVAMSWISNRGLYIRTNLAMREMLGYTHQELSNMRLLDCVHADHRPAAGLAIDSILGGAADSVVEETAMLRRDGRKVWVIASVRAIRNPAGEARYILVQFQDITGRRNAEEQLFQAQKMEALGNFAGGIAHDFNNLLLPIIALTEIARDEMPNESPTKENLEMVLSAAHQASKLVKQILTFSRRSERHIDAVDISHCIADALSLLRNILPSTIKLCDEIAPDVGTVMADRAQLQSVIMNLGGNAADAMQDKGELTVSLARLSACAELAARQPLIKKGFEYAKITVTDTGSGMDRRTLDKIFNPFFTTKPVGEGSGLGLSMVHGIIEDLEGTIEVTSALGVGTTFEIYLPLAAQPAKAPHPAELAEKSR